MRFGAALIVAVTVAALLPDGGEAQVPVEDLERWFVEPLGLPAARSIPAAETVGPLLFEEEQLLPFVRVPAHRAVMNVVMRGRPEALLGCPEHLWVLESSDPGDMIFAGLWWLRMKFPHMAVHSFTTAILDGAPQDAYVHLLLMANEASRRVILPEGRWLLVAAAAAERFSGQSGEVARYLLGRELLNLGRPDLADPLLSGIPLGSALQARSAYFRGLAALAMGRWRGAVAAFRTSCDLAESEGQVELADLAHLALARLAAHLEQFSVAELHYRSVSPGSPRFHEALQELVSVLALSGRAEDAFGPLTVLAGERATPFSHPDSGLLFALVMHALCHWEAAERIAGDWKRILEGALRVCEEQLKGLTPENAFDRVEAMTVGEPPRALLPIIMEVVRDQETYSLHKNVSALGDEMKRAAKLPNRVSALAVQLLGGMLEDAARQRSERVHSVLTGIQERLRDALSRTAEELIDIPGDRIRRIEATKVEELLPETSVATEPMVLAAVVDMTRAGAGDGEILDEVGKLVGRKPLVLSDEDLDWLLKMRVSPDVVDRLGEIGNRRIPTEEMLPLEGGPGLAWHGTHDLWLDELAGFHGGLESRCDRGEARAEEDLR